MNVDGVAYLAPNAHTRESVARQLRRDFGPLDIVVEQVSPALEIDNIEAELLHQKDPRREFRVLIATPENLI